VTVEDRWILSRLRHARDTVGTCIERYDFSRAALELYDFVFSELCDWYLELVKQRLYDGDADTAATLLYVLTETLVLAHPLIPFVTEEIYSYVPGAEGLLAARVREPLAAGSDPAAEAELGRLIEAVQALRGWRNSAEVRPGQSLPARLNADGYEQTATQLARLARLDFSETNGAEAAAAIPIPGGVVEILAGAGVDLGAAERKREAARATLQAEIERCERKLGNAGFVAKAPAAVVQSERDKLARLRSELEAL
jgi:valyl-tRNA synthetase